MRCVLFEGGSRGVCSKQQQHLISGSNSRSCAVVELRLCLQRFKQLGQPLAYAHVCCWWSQQPTTIINKPACRCVLRLALWHASKCTLAMEDVSREDQDQHESQEQLKELLEVRGRTGDRGQWRTTTKQGGQEGAGDVLLLHLLLPT